MEINDLRISVKNKIKEIELLNQRSKEMEQDMAAMNTQKLKENMAERDDQIIELQNDLDKSEIETKDLRDKLDAKSKEFNELLTKFESSSRENEANLKKN